MSRKIRLLLGGSPCTYWSISQKNNRETEPEGLGWELFKNYLIAKEKFKPDYFLYENNKSAAPPIKDQISKELKTPLQYINSSLVSAQNRQRFYAHNIPDVPQPTDRGLLIKDILESGSAWNEKSYALTASYNGAVAWNTIERKQRTMIAEALDYQPYGELKSGKNGLYCVSKDGTTAMGYTVNYIDGKAPTVISGQASKMKIIEPIRIGNSGSNSQGDRVYSPYGKSFALTAYYSTGQNPEHTLKKSLGTMVAESWDGKTYPIYEVKNGLITIKGKQYPIKLPDGYYIIRKLTVLECQRLQTVRDNYLFPVSDSQAYKLLGNGWTVEVIRYILSHIPNLNDCEIEVLSMYDGMSCGNLALEAMGCMPVRYVSYEIDKYAIQTTQTNFPFVEQRGDAFQVREPYWQYDNGQLRLSI